MRTVVCLCRSTNRFEWARGFPFGLMAPQHGSERGIPYFSYPRHIRKQSASTDSCSCVRIKAYPNRDHKVPQYSNMESSLPFFSFLLIYSFIDTSISSNYIVNLSQQYFFGDPACSISHSYSLLACTSISLSNNSSYWIYPISFKTPPTSASSPPS